MILPAKGHAKDSPKPTTAIRPSLPPLKPASSTTSAPQKAEAKPAVTEKAETAAPFLTPVAAAVAAPQSTPAKPEPPAATATTKKPLLKKLTRKGDILKVLSSGSTLTHTTEGLYRIANPDGSENRVSKRRAASFVSQGLLKVTKTDAVGKHYVLDPEAEKKAEERPVLKSESSQRAV